MPPDLHEEETGCKKYTVSEESIITKAISGGE